MFCCLDGVEHRRDAGVGAIEDGDPVVAGAGANGCRDARPGCRPSVAVVLRSDVGVVSETEASDKLRMKLRFEGTDCQPLLVRGLVHVVPRRTGVEVVRAAWTPPTGGA